MKNKELPEWFKKFVDENVEKNAFEEYDRMIAKACFDFLSKPENLAKFPEVRALVADLRGIIDDLETPVRLGLDNLNPDWANFNKAKEDLKPFSEVGDE